MKNIELVHNEFSKKLTVSSHLKLTNFGSSLKFLRQIGRKGNLGNLDVFKSFTKLLPLSILKYMFLDN